MSPAPEEVGKRLKAARRAKGWTQIEFATQHAHVSLGTVSRWERGFLPAVGELMRIAELLGVNIDTLMEPAEDLSVSRRLDHLEAVHAETFDLLQKIAARLDVPVRPGPFEDEEPTI